MFISRTLFQLSATATLLGAALVAAPLAAQTSGFEAFGKVEGWNVFVDSDKKTCLIEAVDAVENVVQMGLTKDRGVGYIGIFTKAKTDLKRGDKSEIAVVLGENLYVGEATAMRGNITKGYSGGYILTDNPQVVEDVAQQYEMIVFPEKEYAFVVDLTGTKKAIEMARECNTAQLK